jgi:hypothetical protein
MRRSRAFILFGGFWIVFAVATVTARSHAADRLRARGSSAAVVSGSVAGSPELRLLPRPGAGPATHDPAAAFGSFARLGSAGTLPSEAGCPPEMVEVEGDYCPYVEQKCLRWLDPTTRLQCAEFDKASSSPRCSMKTQHKRFCIDRYEWPNKVGALPRYMASWYEAKASCEATGKRLCSDTEWTLACEGEDRRPYPYGDGYARDQQACNIDKPYIWPQAAKVYDPRTSSISARRAEPARRASAPMACTTWSATSTSGSSTSRRPESRISVGSRGATGGRCAPGAAR